MTEASMPPLSPRMPAEISPERLMTSNLAALAACDLELSRRVGAARLDSVPEGVTVLSSALGAPTVRAGGLLIHSAHDPIGEAAWQARQVPEDAPRVMVVGFGAGHLIAALLARPALRRLDVVPVNAAVLHGVSQRVDLKPLLCDPRVRFLPEDPNKVTAPCAVVPPLLELAETRLSRLGQSARDYLAVGAVRQHRDARRSFLVAEQGRNQAICEATPRLDTLAGRHGGGTALLCDDGPSLEAITPLLGQLRAGARQAQLILLSTEDALPWLLDHGILPDYTAAVTCRADHAGPPRASLPAGGTLVHAPWVSAALLREWRGPRVCALPGELPPRRAALAPLESALGLLAHLAVHMGAANLILCGADLAFPAGQGPLHADEAAGVRSWHRQVVAVGGGTVAASAEHAACRLTIEEVLAEHATLRAIHTSPAGARIAGTTEAPLTDAVARLKLRG